ncbi:MAG: RsmE family RNA methyltransferase [Candidatus Paceibacterota bacterium]|jgi:16S rRNA (uracil1498-N3)-methyltransferase
MRLHRFYISEKIGERTKLAINSADLTNQIVRVFRLGIGDRIVLFDGSGFDYECVLDKINEKSKMIPNSLIELSVAQTRSSGFLPRREVYLCASVVKKDNFEFIVEKATELGVTKIIPVISERSEKKSLNEERLKKISIEASEQSGRGNLPVILPIMDLEAMIEDLVAEVLPAKVSPEEVSLTQVPAHVKKPLLLAFHTSGDTLSSIPDLKSNEPIVVFIGPEGGWSDKEIAMFHSYKIQVVCLGSQILRSETAVVAALSKVLL